MEDSDTLGDGLSSSRLEVGLGDGVISSCVLVGVGATNEVDVTVVVPVLDSTNEVDTGLGVVDAKADESVKKTDEVCNRLSEGKGDNAIVDVGGGEVLLGARDTVSNELEMGVDNGDAKLLLEVTESRELDGSADATVETTLLAGS